MNNIHYASIRNLDISNGEGVGVALFVQGCPFNPHCYNCFNPNTWDFNGGKEWTQDTEDKLIELANRPYIKRLSILGGEPLADENLDGVLHLVDRFRLSLPNKSIWLYSGYELSLKKEYIPVDDFWNDEDEEYYRFITDPKDNNISDFKRSVIISKCDVVIDGRYIDSQRNPSKKFAGSDNQRVIDIRKSLEQNQIVLHCD